MKEETDMFARLVIAGAIGLICFEAGAQTDAPLPSGVKVVWDSDKALHEKTPTRERVCINGLWRWQPAAAGAASVPADNWGFFKVPAPWPGHDQFARKESQTAYPHPNWKDQDLTKVIRAWYQREMTVPADWAGRRIALAADYLNSVATVYIDGKKVGKLCFPGGELDLTSAVQPGSKHVLSMFVEALPMKETVLAFNDTNMPQEIKGSVNFRGLCGDVFLTSTPAQARVTNVKIDTSVRQWNLTLHADLTQLTAGTEYKVQAKISDQGQVVKTLTSAAFKDADLKSGRFSFTEAWKPEKLWDINTPKNQYDLELSLLDGAGKTVDVFLPVRFGFRELWIDGRDFILNGTRVFWQNKPLDNTHLGPGCSTYAAVKETIERMQSIGINMVYTHNYDCKPGSHLSFEEMLKAADDMGILVSFTMPHFHDYDWKVDDAGKSNGYAQHAAFYARVAQNHPSVIAYSTSHNASGYFEVMNPDLIDGIYQPKDYEKKDNVKKALTVQNIIQQIDPTRIVYHHSSGNLGSMWTSNFYLDFVPVQERSDWFEHWATKGVKPAFTCEYGMPYFMNWTMYRGYYQGKLPWQGHGGRVPYELCIAEWDSSWLGDSAFKLSDNEKTDLRWEAQKFNEGKVWQHWEYPVYFGPPVFDGIQEVVARYNADNWRAFRTWGMSATSPWCLDHNWKLKDGADKSRKDFKVDWDKLQRPGYSPDYVDARFESFANGYERDDWVPTVAGKELVRNYQPLLAYLGGKPAAFTEKGHNFRGGETVEKQIIIVNNSRVTVNCDCAWSLKLPSPITGSAKFSSPTGDIHKDPFKFTLPADVKPGIYTLSLSVKFTPGGTQEDSFTINVAAPDPAPTAIAKVAIFDPAGETTKLLGAMGVHGDAVGPDADLSKYEMLIVGKHALTPEGPGPNLSRVREGLKAIVFEQRADVLEQRFGFRVQEYGMRNVFRRVPDHPVLAGLDEDLLRDWRGEATTMEPRLKYEERAYPLINPVIVSAGVVVTRPWRCGNRGNVASVLIEKPACGDFMSLIDCGYSLQYSPLMEYHEGQGLVLFCQMDVTGRTDTDPTAERLTKNILGYVNAFKPATNRSIVYAGDPAGQKYLQQAGFTVEPYANGALKGNRVLVVGPGGASALASEKATVASWLKQDGRILALGLEGNDASTFLPMTVSTKQEEHIGSFFEPQPLNSPLVGVGPADVHNRDPRNFPLIGGGAKVVGDGILAFSDDGHVTLCQMLPWQFNNKQQNTKRTFRRTSSLLTRLLGNLGVQSQTPLLERFSKPVKLTDGQSSEKRWSSGFYLDTPEEWDDPYRFFGW
jgi:hypothetical protein